jgi:RNA polymerase sigma-70 factor (ECF subfamily)
VLGTLEPFEARIEQSARLVYQIAYGVLRNHADAQDVMQDVFLRAYRKRSSLRELEKFQTWVSRIARRLALNRWRSESRARRRDTIWFERSAPAHDVETIATDRDEEARIRAAIEALPGKLRSVLMLSAIDGLNARAIAHALRIPEGTVRSRLFAARKRLRAAIAVAAAAVLAVGIAAGTLFERHNAQSRSDAALLSNAMTLTNWHAPSDALLPNGGKE